MNLFRRELRAHLKALIIWPSAMAVFMFMCMAKYQTISGDNSGALQQAMKAFPHSVQAIFGMTGLDLATVPGYFGVCFLFIVIILAVHAGLTGGGFFAEEELTHTTEFLYTKPRTRTKIFITKLLAGLLHIIILWAITMIASIVAIGAFAQMDGFWHDFLRLMCAMGIIQLTFYSFGIAAATYFKKSALYGRAVTIAVFASYLLYVFAQFSSHVSWLHYASILSYFNATDIITAHALKIHYIAACLLAACVFILIGRWRFVRHDFTV